MALTVQNLRAVGTGVEPASLLPGQIAFNVTDKVLYVGDGSSFKTQFDGTQVAGVTGEGWYSMPMDFESLGDYYVPNPGYYGDVPLDQQVLTWSDALQHPIWTNNGGGAGGNQVYILTNAQVAAAPGATTSDKITSAINLSASSPDEGDVCIVTGLPDEVYEGLYFYTTEWVKGAAYAYPSATEVIYDNTGRALGPTVQIAIDDLDDVLTATTAIANTANSTANSALSIASAALPRSGGTMTGTIVSQNINVPTGYGVLFNNSVAGAITGVTDSTSTTSSTIAASATGLKASYDLANAAVPRSSFVSPGDLLVGTGSGTFAPLPAGSADYILASDGAGGLTWVQQSEGDVTAVTGAAPITVDNTDPQNPVVGVNLATTATPGVVQVELTGNINLVGGVINVPDGSTTVKGAVQLYNSLSGGSTSLALTAAAGSALQSQIDALTLSNSVTLAGGYNATTGLVDGATTQGIAAGFVDGNPPPAPAPGNADYYLICTASGSNPSAMENGDWLLSDGTQYVVLGVGARPASASYTQAGIVQLADGAAVLAGTSDTTAITPQALQDNVVDSVTTTNSSLIASATAVKAAYDAAVSAQTTANAALPKTGGTMTGDIVFHSGQIFPVSGIQNATTSQKGVVQVGANINVSSGTISVDTGSTTVAGILQLTDSTSSTSITTAATPNSVKTAYDAAVAAALWTETAGVLSPVTPNTVVTVDVPMGIDGVTVTDSVLSVSTLISPAQAVFLDNIQSVTVNGSDSRITHVVDSTTGITPGILAVDEVANFVPYNLQIGELQLNGNAGSAGYVLTSNGPGSPPTWEVNAADGVQSVSGISPITVDNTDAANPIVGIDAASTTQAGAVQLNDTVTSTSDTEAATASAVKVAYDAAYAAQVDATQALAEVITAQTDATQALTDAAAAQTTANAALPKDGGTMTGNITFQDAGEGVVFSNSSAIYAISDLVTSTSSTTAASSAAVKAAYDAAVGAQTNGPLTSNTVLYVNCTDGNDLTGARGTDFPFATIGAALAAASEGDTIFLSAGTFTENFTISKGVHLAGTFSDQATWSGTKILGNVVVNLVGAGVIRNLAVSNIYFISANSTSPMSITGMSPGAGGINTFTGCTFTQQDVTSTTQFAFQTSGTWTRSVYLRNCTIDGNFRHNAGTAAGASGYIVIDQLWGVGNPNMYHSILTGTVEYRNPSNTLASILQTGGVVLINNASSGITANNAVTSSVFGGTGFSYKGSAAAAGAGTVYFQGGSNQGTGKVDIGANLIYGWTNLAIDPANLTVSGSAIAYTTAVPSAANAQSITQQRPRLDLLRVPSSVSATNRLDMVVDSTTGATYSVTPLWLPLTTQTLTTTTATTILTLPIASVRGVTVNISVSDATGGRFYNDSWMVIHNGTTTNTQLAAPGARIGTSPYTLTSTISGANLLIQVTSASTNSTKYVGSYQTFAV